jgi:hypothetical protein
MVRVLGIAGKGFVTGAVISLTWGVLFYVISGGSQSHFLQGAMTMGAIWVLLFALAALVVARSQTVRLWIATKGVRKPSWRAMLIIGAFWGSVQGGIIFAFSRSPARALLVAGIWLAMFIVFPLMLWSLFGRELNAAV